MTRFEGTDTDQPALRTAKIQRCPARNACAYMLFPGRGWKRYGDNAHGLCVARAQDKKKRKKREKNRNAMPKL